MRSRMRHLHHYSEAKTCCLSRCERIEPRVPTSLATFSSRLVFCPLHLGCRLLTLCLSVLVLSFLRPTVRLFTSWRSKEVQEMGPQDQTRMEINPTTAASATPETSIVGITVTFESAQVEGPQGQTEKPNTPIDKALDKLSSDD